MNARSYIRGMSASDTDVTGGTTRGRGRPRDPHLEDRVYEAAIKVYADSGWAGFTFDAIAKEAVVGKAALYRRWEGREQLLDDTLTARRSIVAEINTGSVHGDLVNLAKWLFADLSGPHRGVAAWLRADASHKPQIATTAASYHDLTIAQCRAIVRRAIERGELPATINAALLMDLVIGGVTNHVAATPERLKPTMLQKADNFIDILARAAIAGTIAAAAYAPATD